MTNTTILSLPLEIMENILNYLEGNSLINASKVCWQWKIISQRLMYKECCKIFSTELHEDIILDVEEKLGDKTLEVYREAIEEINVENELEGLELSHHISALETSDTFVFIGDCTGNILSYSVVNLNLNPYISPEPVATASLPDGPVMNLGLMKCHDLLIAASSMKMYIFSTATISNNNSIILHPLNSNVSIEQKNLVIKVHKDLVGIAEGGNHIKIYQVINCDDKNVVLKEVADIETQCSVYRWKIWDDMVMCVLKTGGLVVWNITDNKFSYVSDPVHELRYQNPCWMYQRYILCSSELSRNLLYRYIYMMPTCPSAYWHISCGPSYWLFGRLDGKESPEPQKYRGVLSPDVTTMCLRRRIFVCARKSPDQILVYLMPRNLPHDKEALTIALQNPVLTLPAPGYVILLEMAFIESKILIFSVSQPCLLHCYILNRSSNNITPPTSPSPTPENSEIDEISEALNIDPNLAYPVVRD